MDKGRKKRLATLYMGVLLLGLWGCSFLFIRFKINDLLLIFIITGVLVFCFYKRNLILPFRFRCIECGAKLTIKQLLFSDSNLCTECEVRPEENAES